MTTFKVVKKLCDERKISINDLEKALGYSKNTLYRLKTQNPGADKLQVLADYFDVSTDYLLGRTAFRKPMELFEHWGGQISPYFESSFDFGGLLREERVEQNIKQQEVSKALGITESDVDDIEEGILPLNYEWAEKYAGFLGTSVQQIFNDNNMNASLDDIPLELFKHYQEQDMSETEMTVAYSKFKAEQTKDAVREAPETYAAHHEGEDWTEEELEEIERFKEFVRSKRKGG